jgi:hypothetical protein
MQKVSQEQVQQSHTSRKEWSAAHIPTPQRIPRSKENCFL